MRRRTEAVAPWKSVTHVGDVEVCRKRRTFKQGPLVAIEYDAYVDIGGLRFWREARGHGLGTVRANRRGYGDEVWWFADGPVSVMVKDYGRAGGWGGWHGGRSYNLPTREAAFEAAVECARTRAVEEVRKAEGELADAKRVLKKVTGEEVPDGGR